MQAAGDEDADGSPVWRGRELSDTGPISSRPAMVSRGFTASSELSSASTIQLSVPSNESPPITPGPRYNPFTGRTVASPEPSIMLSPMSNESVYEGHLARDRSMSAEIVNPHDRHFSVQSMDPDEGHIAMRKWDNGTKFQEAIQ